MIATPAYNIQSNGMSHDNGTCNQSAHVDNVPHAIEVNNKSNDNDNTIVPKQDNDNVVTVMDDDPVKPPDTIPAFTPWIIGASDLVPSDHQQQRQQTNQKSIDNCPIPKGSSSSFPLPSPRALTNRKSEGFIPTHTDNRLSNRPTAIDDSALSHSAPSESCDTYTNMLLNNPPSTSVESILASACEICTFDIAEVWLRTGPKTHQLINSHLRPAGIMENSVRKNIVDVYYSEKASERRHRLSPALCKRAKEAKDVVWVTASTPQGAEALRVSLNDVRTAVAVPVCHTPSCTNITFIYFSIKRATMKPPAVELLIHMSLAAAVASVNSLSDQMFESHKSHASTASTISNASTNTNNELLSAKNNNISTSVPVDLKWSQLRNVEYLTDGANSWIHTAVMNGKPVAVKTLKPECQDMAHAINEIEDELAIHSKLKHNNIVKLYGAGTTSKGHRFIVLERLDGGTLTQVLGYDTRIRDRRRRFWKKKNFALKEVLSYARALADALAYCHGRALPNGMILHRDLKPDNMGFTLDGTLKLMDFGLARVMDNASSTSDETYAMSGETGSLRYMSPEVAESKPYNHKADVFSFGILLWELFSCKKPFDGLNRDSFYERVVHGGGRPPIHKKWPKELTNLMIDCWSVDIEARPSFQQIVERIDSFNKTSNSKHNRPKSPSNHNPIRSPKQIMDKRKNALSTMIDRHSTWF